MAKSPMSTFKYFVTERERIRLARLAGKGGPWTKDPILQKYRFCNVHRRDDRVSRWLIEHVLTEEHIEYDLKSFLLFSALCRWINWPPTIQAILDAGLYPKKRLNFKKIGQLLDGRAAEQKVWTGAYMIRAPRTKGAKKGAFIAEEVIGVCLKEGALEDLVGAFSELREEGDGVLYQAAWKMLRKAPNFGGFMAGQIAGDWTYTGLLSGAADLKTWAPMGPGSVRGFNRLFKIEPIKKRPKEDLWLEKLPVVHKIVSEQLGTTDLTALDAQNCLCEFDKYLRVKSGEGRPRATYKPHEY